MSYENKSNLSTDSNLGHNLGSGSGSGSHASGSGSAPMTMVYTNEQSKHHPQPLVNNQYVTYQQTIYKVPKFEFPKIRYDYGLPDYNRVYVDRSIYNPHINPYKIRDDRISQFFIGSATVLGLFLLYRILDKNK
jgi:hypothetical protein